jgi:hypothetical protein
VPRPPQAANVPVPTGGRVRRRSRKDDADDAFWEFMKGTD